MQPLSLLDSVLILGVPFYAIFIWWLGRGINRSRCAADAEASSLTSPSVSVIIAARDEADCIDTCLEALAAQDYSGFLQTIVVDDRSVDDTAHRVQAWVAKWPSAQGLMLISSPRPAVHAGPKKNALAAGIAASNGQLLLFTDADCRPSPQWVGAMVASFTSADVGMVVGFADSQTSGFVEAMLAVDNLGIGALAEGALGNGAALSCSGRNLAYRRSLYDQVHGFDAIGHLISGDDVYFMRHVVRTCAARIVFCAKSDAIVGGGRGDEALTTVLWRKVRHASKASRYDGGARLLGIAVYLYHLTLAAGLMRTLTGGTGWVLFATAWLLRWAMDAALLWRFCLRASDRRRLWTLPFVEFLYIPYVLLFVPFARLVGFRWRGVGPASARD